MTFRPGRRRFLTISAAWALAGAGLASDLPETRWRGSALGAAASLRIVGLSPDAAAPILTAVERELSRLETVFSLYRPKSALVRLNAEGRIDAPPSELLEVLSLSDRLHSATDGAFDPTVQPIFAAHARAANLGRPALAEEITAARATVGWDAVQYDEDSVRLNRPGAGITLNGIAQGYVTDRIADLLTGRGLADILVDIGEIAALGHRPGGTAWTAGIAGSDGHVLRRLTLSDRALATSAPKGTVLDASGHVGHIFDPGNGREAMGASVVAVSADRAVIADGLSTALCILPKSKRMSALAAFPSARLEIAI